MPGSDSSIDDAMRHTGSGARRNRSDGRRRRRRTTGIVIAAVVLLVVLPLGAAAGWLLFRVLDAKDALESAQATMRSVQSGEVDLRDGLTDVGASAALAVAAADDPVWQAAEALPVVGDNLRAVRVASETLEVLSIDLGVPLLTATDGDGPILAAVLPIVTSTVPVIQQRTDEIAELRSSTELVGEVRTAIDQLGEVLDAAAPFLAVGPGMLGVDGPRNYLLVFQNNAELVPLGGSAASQTLITVDGGDLTIVGQAGSRQFANGAAVDVAVDQSAIDLYSAYLVDHVNTAPSRPDFPTAAQILAAFWQRDISNVPIDAVVSIDPIALARILEATGPIVLATGDELTSENTLPLLLSESYARWPGSSDESDLFFASVAQSVFERIKGGDFDIMALADAIGESAETGDIMLWSAAAEAQALIAPMPVSGILPVDNSISTTVGVFYRDTSSSKIDYYMKGSTALSATCDADGVSRFTASTTLMLDLDPAVAVELPKYVKGQWQGRQFAYEFYLYGPPGTTVESVTLGGNPLKIDVVRNDIIDLGRPVVKVLAFVEASQSATVTATFVGPAGDYGPLALRSTPLVQGTEVTIDDSSCST